MSAAPQPAPRWRTVAKIALTIVVTIIAVPSELTTLFGSMQKDRR